MFIKYSTHQIPPKKSRGKGSQWKKTIDTFVEEVEVSEESDLEPAKKKTSSKRRVKKKVTLSANDNIISNDPDVALELVSESVRRRKSGKETSDPPKKLKGVPSLTLEEREAADIMQALKESRKSSRRQPCTRGSDEGTGSILGVLDESIVVSATSSEGTGIKPGVLDEEKDITKEKVILEWGDEQDSEYSDDDNDDVEKDDKDGDADDEDDDHIRVRKDEDAKMADAEVEEFDKGDEEVTDAAKEDAEKTSEVKDDPKKTELPPTSLSLSVSLGFGDQFLKLSSKSSLVGTVKDSADADVSSLIDIPIQQETPQTQSPSVQKVPILVIPETTNLPPIPEVLTETPVSTAVS
ncbi:hypothetical protein Tco_0958547 [Tanacetum coccineum]